MKIHTAITHLRDEKEIIRGEELEKLMREGSFVSTIFLILTSRKATADEERMLNALFTSVIDHGPAVASALSARISASAKNPMHASLAAGLLSLGDRHGVALSAAMHFFVDHKDDEDLKHTVSQLRAQKVRVPGYGHKFFTDKDPRSDLLFEIARETGVYGAFAEFAQTLHVELNAVSSKSLPLNVDGAIAAILCDMGVDPELGNAIFMIGRVPGLLAHIAEERENDVGIRRLDNDDVDELV